MAVASAASTWQSSRPHSNVSLFCALSFISLAVSFHRPGPGFRLVSGSELLCAAEAARTVVVAAVGADGF